MSNPLLLVPACLKSFNFKIKIKDTERGQYPDLIITGITKEHLEETKDIILENQFKSFKYEKLIDELRDFTHNMDENNSGDSFSGQTMLQDLKEMMRMYL